MVLEIVPTSTPKTRAKGRASSAEYKPHIGIQHQEATLHLYPFMCKNKLSGLLGECESLTVLRKGARERGLGHLLTTIGKRGKLVVLAQSEADIRKEQERSAGLDTKNGKKT